MARGPEFAVMRPELSAKPPVYGRNHGHFKFDQLDASSGRYPIGHSAKGRVKTMPPRPIAS